MLELALAVLLVARPALAERLPFEVRGDRGTGDLTFTLQVDAQGAATLKRTIRVTVVGETTRSTNELRIVAPIVVESETGSSVELRAVVPAARDLAPGDALPIVLEASFPNVGVYRGELALVQKAQNHFVPLQITVSSARSRDPLPAQESGGVDVAVEAPPWNHDATQVPLHLANTDRKPLVVVATVAGVARVDKSDAPTHRFSVAGQTTPSAPKTIAPGGVEEFVVKGGGIDSAGIYSVETAFGDPAGMYQPRTTKTTVYRREPWWTAAFFVLLGAGIAWGIRGFLSGGNERLALRRRLALLVERVRVARNGALNEEVILAARVFELEVEERQRDARWGKLDELKTVTNRMEQRGELLADVVTAMTQLERIDASSQTQATARKELDAALAIVRNDPGDEKIVTDRRQAVAGLGLKAVRREELRARLSELHEAIASQLRIATSALPVKLRAEMNQLESADALVQTDDLNGLEKLLDGVRGRVLDACIEALDGCAKAPAPPLGVPAPEWQAACADIIAQLETARSMTDWKPKNTHLQKAQKRYITTVVTGAIHTATELARAGDSRAARLNEIADDLKKTLATSTIDAAERYRDYLPTISTPDPRTGATRGQISTQAPEATAPLTAATWAPFWLHEWLPFASARPPTAQRLEVVIRSWEWLVALGVLVIAVLSGVRLLWLENLAWGGTSAWLVAFLWGAGVQATGDAFAGVMALRAKLGGIGASS